MKLTISKEDYLKAIAEAESEEGSVIAATIARWLGVTRSRRGVGSAPAAPR